MKSKNLTPLSDEELAKVNGGGAPKVFDFNECESLEDIDALWDQARAYAAMCHAIANEAECNGKEGCKWIDYTKSSVFSSIPGACGHNIEVTGTNEWRI